MKDFIKTVLAVFIGLILFSILGTGVAVLTLFSVGSKLEETSQQLDQDSILVYDLSLSISDRPQETENFVPLEEPWNITLRSLLETIKAAKTDNQIKALLLNGEQGYVGAGFGSIKEIRKALEDFKTSGKPIIAYGVDWFESGYYLATVADTIVVNPIGSLALDGFEAEVQFYGGALEKYGLGMQVVRVGKYKSAVEPYTEKKFSAANRQQLQTLLGDLWTELLTSVENDRGVKVAALRTLSQQQGILTPTVALQKGLVDKVQHWDEVQETLKQLSAGTAAVTAPSPETSPEPSPDATPTASPQASSPQPSATPPSSDPNATATEESSLEASFSEEEPEEAFPQIAITEYSHLMEPADLEETAENEIAIVYAEGTIISGEGGLGVIGSEEYVSVLQDLRRDEEVKAVVLRINSPGGSATASHLIEREVKLLQGVKPVIVSMGDIAASGGYMIAAPAQTIVAEPNTITGSIGVYGLLPNAQKFANNNGVTWDSVTTGPYANLYTIARPRTASEMALLQKFVDQLYADFVDLVAKGRKLPPSKVNEIAQGRVWSGVSAQKVKLVDELGGLQTAIDRAVAAAKLEEGTWYIAEYPYVPTFEEEIINRLFGEVEFTSLSPSSFLSQWLAAPDSRATPSPPVAEMMENMQADWETLLEFSDPRQIYMRLPYRLEIE
jgi:protease IV